MCALPLLDLRAGSAGSGMNDVPTEREQDVTRLVLQGDWTVEIAERQVVSTHTVGPHLKTVFDKDRRVTSGLFGDGRS